MSASRVVCRGKRRRLIALCHIYIHKTALYAPGLLRSTLDMLEPDSEEPRTVYYQVNIGGGRGGNGGGGGSNGGDGGPGEAPRIVYHVHAEYFSMVNNLCAAPGMNLEDPHLLGNFAESSDKSPPSPVTNRGLPLPLLDEIHPPGIAAPERRRQRSLQFTPTRTNDGEQDKLTGPFNPGRFDNEIEREKINLGTLMQSPSDQRSRRLEEGQGGPSLSVLRETRREMAQTSQGSPPLGPTLTNGDVREQLMKSVLKMIADVEREKLNSEGRGDPTLSLLEEFLPYILPYIVLHMGRSQTAPQFGTRRTNDSASTDFSSMHRRKYDDDIERLRKHDEMMRNITLQNYLDGEMRPGCFSCWRFKRIGRIRPERKEYPGPIPFP
ncbi:hypothetical protein B0H12DRAFT_1168596 [Mycena haematopus]|nr:hypothetical protein B0H12DRAFT_1168596 [Mycena haematopus]